MGISKESYNANTDFRTVYFRIRERLEEEISRRVTSRVSTFHVLKELRRETFGLHNFSLISSITASRPSVVTIRSVIDDLIDEFIAERYSIPDSYIPLILPRQMPVPSAKKTDLGSAVDNLGFEQFLNKNDKIDYESWRIETVNLVIQIGESLLAERKNASARIGLVSDSPPEDEGIEQRHYNPRTFQPSELTLQEAITVMNSFDLDREYTTIRLTLLGFSLVITGLAECPKRDLHSVVSQFIELFYHFRPDIALCVRPIDDPLEPNAIGVLFERISSVNYIVANKSSLLGKTSFSVRRNSDLRWIIWNYRS